jgi:hypothetical protein
VKARDVTEGRKPLILVNVDATVMGKKKRAASATLIELRMIVDAMFLAGIWPQPPCHP